MNLLTFDLNLLRVLDALLHEKSTVKAGERLGLSQPAVSAALGRLRKILDDPLFVRQGQRIVPTPFAVALDLPLRTILDDLADLLSKRGSFDPGKSVQSFKISGSDFFAEMLMPPLAKYLSTAVPKILVQLVDLRPSDYVGTLENYEIDLALVPKAEFPTWVDHQVVFRSEFVLVARRRHPRLVAAGINRFDTVPIDLFCDLGHIVFSPEGNLRAMGDSALERVGRERKVVMTMPVFGGICTAVAGSDLVALLPEQLARRVADKHGLSIYAAPVPLPTAEMCMIWHKRYSASMAHRWLRDTIVDSLSAMAPD